MIKGEVESSCEYVNEPLGSINCRGSQVAEQLVTSRVVLSSIYIFKHKNKMTYVEFFIIKFPPKCAVPQGV
jgi:hypothetical protein